MRQLVVTDPEGRQYTVSLGRERIVIGRRSDNDLSLEDSAVSGRHAAIICLSHEIFVEDLGSTNGTQVNGRLIAKQLLTDGDEITVGRHQIRVELTPTTPGLEAPKLRPAPKSPTPRASEAPATPAPPPAGVLRIESGPQSGREIALDKPLATIGKPGVQVAAITRRADGYFIVDAGRTGNSTRPILLNGQSLGHQACRLNPGDLLEIAGAQMRFQLL